MLADLHATTLASLPVATAVACGCFWRRPRAWRAALGVALGAVFALVGITFAGGWRVPDAPFAQWVIPALCAAAVGVCVSHRGVAVAGAALLGAAMWFLLLSHVTLANSRRYTANSEPFAFLEEWRGEVREKMIRHLEATARDDDGAYPAGWLVECVPAGAGWWTLGAIRHQACHRTIVTPLWHSWLTGLRHTRVTRVDLWYPGGRLRSAAREIEWRRRP